MDSIDQLSSSIDSLNNAPEVLAVLGYGAVIVTLLFAASHFSHSLRQICIWLIPAIGISTYYFIDLRR